LQFWPNFACGPISDILSHFLAPDSLGEKVAPLIFETIYSLTISEIQCRNPKNVLPQKLPGIHPANWHSSFYINISKDLKTFKSVDGFAIAIIKYWGNVKRETYEKKV
jgi:hypothetical protein